MHAAGDDGTMAVIPGCAARKNHSSRRDAFTSINQPNIATITVTRGEATLNLEDAYNTATTSLERTTDNSPVLFDANIKILQLVSGSHLYADQIKHASAHDYSAILFWGTGLGHLPIDNPGNAPENDEVRTSLMEYLESGGVVAMATQCISGPVHLDVYSKGREQQEIGVLGHGTNFPPETALVKLHHLLSCGLGGEELALAWRENLAGENPSDI
jgi:glutamyl-tRNA(Gln) amidotransferase subunit D